ncbi:MAG: polysaccharide deacetylase family protein [Firmicutes bacterium]|nr:polysaccharide deacetylase family protein [Bacillota bacterium]
MRVLFLGRRGWSYAAVALIALFGGILLGRLTLFWPVQPTLAEMPLFYVKTEEPKIALTFDISWGEETLPRVLPILAQAKVRATFFLSGPWAESHPALVRAIQAGGHEIASHGQEHVNLSEYSEGEIRENIGRAHRILSELTRGRVAYFFRPPNGDYDDLVVVTARSQNYETVIWAVDSLDWKNPGADYMIRRVVEKAFPGAIILCHASDSSRQIHEALPGMIAGLRAKGYQFVTLSQLVQCGTPGRDDPR